MLLTQSKCSNIDIYYAFYKLGKSKVASAWENQEKIAKEERKINTSLPQNNHIVITSQGWMVKFELGVQLCLYRGKL